MHNDTHKRSDKRSDKQKANVRAKKSKVVRRLQITFVTLLILAGLGLVLNQQLMYMTLHSVSQSDKPGKGVKPVFDASAVTSVGATDVAKVALDRDKFRASGQISIPAVGIHLDVYQGLNNEHLLLGAGEAEPRRKVSMGQKGNYVLASHRMYEKGWTLLFSSLGKMRAGDKIYLTDGGKVYEYESTFVKNVNASNDTSDINVKTDDKLITLYTCGEDVVSTPIRTVVRGKLIKEYDVKSASDDELSPFLNDANKPTGYLKYYYLKHGLT